MAKKANENETKSKEPEKTAEPTDKEIPKDPPNTEKPTPDVPKESGNGTGPINTLDPKGNPSEVNPTKAVEENTAKEQIAELKKQIDQLNGRIEELSKAPVKNKEEIKTIEQTIDQKQKKADWILDQYAF